ncbi:MAG TPA: hypothetical protein VGP43_01385 [Chitinophagaceae bacterium]|nr:hypothetical protein [Chitinophagaceae bacterium]
MADNTDEEHLDNPTSNQSEIPPDQVISTNDTKTINQNQETENMEVHHHTHASHGKKTWKDYFWEFLMLFLAVFCGFLAEYQLEHVVEHNREKQYIESMIADLKADSNRVQVIINNNKQYVAGFDSLLQNIYHKPYTDSSIRTLYYLKETYTLVRSSMLFSKGTISQLKNSGGFRLIRNRAAADSIIKYDLFTERVENQGDGVDYAGKKLLDLSVKIFDGECVLDYNSTSNYREILNSTKKFTLLTSDEKLIKEYANLAKFKKDVVINYIRQLTTLQNRIPGIIEVLEKEYHLN